MISGTFYTLEETAAALERSRVTLWKWLKAGKMKGQRLGNVVLIEEKEIRRLQKLAK